MPLPQMPNLQDVFSMNPGAFHQSQGLIQQGAEMEAANLRKQQLANMFDEQNDPLRVEHQRGLNESLFARVPGERANSQSLELKAQRDAAGQQDAIALARKKFMQEASDADIKMLGNKAQEMAYSSDPKIREQGVRILSMHKDILAEKEKQNTMAQRQLELERVRGSNARQLQQEGIAGGRYAKSGGGVGKSIEEQIASGKLNYEKASTMYAGMAMLAAQSGDVETAQQYETMANQYAAKAVELRAAGAVAGQAGKPDMAAISGLPVRPQQPAAPYALPGQQPTKAPVGATTNSPLLRQLPQGTQDNGDGTFTLPDGRKVRPKQ